MLKYLILLFFIITFSSCKNQSKDKDTESSFIIYGSMEEGGGYRLFVNNIYSDNFERDSIFINTDGSFQHRIIAGSSAFYSIKNEAGNTITIYSSPNDSIKLIANYYDFRNYKLSGNDESEQITLLNEATQSFLEKISQFSKIIEDSINSPDYADLRTEIDKEYKKEFNDLKIFSENFISNNEESLVSMLALSNQLGRDFFVFHPVNDKEIFYKVDSILFDKYPTFEPVKKLHYQVSELRENAKKTSLFKIGDELPDFSLQDTSGIFLNLHSLRGNIVLIDFWASWCKKCRKENLKLVNIYKIYNSHGFEIVQISLDESGKEWRMAIKEDGLKWIQLSDLKKWNSKVVELYDITSIPANFLLDAEGKIIGKGIDTETLKKQLKNNYTIQ